MTALFRYRAHPVPSPLAGVVDSIWTCEAAFVPFRILPDGRIDLLFRRRESVWRGVVVGVTPRSYVPPPTNDRFIGFRLRVGAAGRLLGLDASELVGSIVELNEIWSVRRALDDMNEAGSDTDALRIVCGLVEERWARRAAADARVRVAVDTLIASGSVRIAAAAVGLSERHLRRIVEHETGATPTLLRRSLRLQSALEAGLHSQEGWAQVAVRTGFSDQAHLIREFRDLVGLTPDALRREMSASFNSGHIVSP